MTGQPPFAGGTSYETIRRVLDQEARPPSQWNPAIDRDLETLCLKCLEKDSRLRYASAREFSVDLECWLAGRPISARPVGAGERFWRWARRNPVLAGLGGATALLLIVVLIGAPIAAFRINRERQRAESHAARAISSAHEPLSLFCPLAACASC